MCFLVNAIVVEVIVDESKKCLWKQLGDAGCNICHNRRDKIERREMTGKNGKETRDEEILSFVMPRPTHLKSNKAQRGQ